MKINGHISIVVIDSFGLPVLSYEFERYYVKKKRTLTPIEGEARIAFRLLKGKYAVLELYVGGCILNHFFISLT